MPILVPLLVVALAVLMSLGASSEGGHTHVQSNPLLLVDQYSPPLSPYLDSHGVPFQHVATVDEIHDSLAAGEFQLGIEARDDHLLPRSIQVFTADRSSRHLQSTLEALQRALDAYYQDQILRIADSLPAGVSSTALLNGPPSIVLSSTAPPPTRPTVPVTLILWAWLLVLPYFQLARIGSSYVIGDLQRGLLTSSAVSGQSMYSFAVSRTVTLTVIGAILLFTYFLVMLLWMALYCWAADWLVAHGLLERLSPERAASMRFAFVDVVHQWRALPAAFFAATILVAQLQLAAMASLLVAGSTYARSIPRSRLYEMLPFGAVFLLPLLTVGFLDNASIMPTAFIPGVNAVFLIHALSSGAWSPYIVPFGLSTTLLISISLALTVRRTTNEAFWLESYT